MARTRRRTWPLAFGHERSQRTMATFASRAAAPDRNGAKRGKTWRTWFEKGHRCLPNTPTPITNRFRVDFPSTGAPENACADLAWMWQGVARVQRGQTTSEQCLSPPLYSPEAHSRARRNSPVHNVATVRINPVKTTRFRASETRTSPRSRASLL